MARMVRSCGCSPGSSWMRPWLLGWWMLFLSLLLDDLQQQLLGTTTKGRTSPMLILVQAFTQTTQSITNLKLEPVYNLFQIAEGTDAFDGNGYLDLGPVLFQVPGRESNAEEARITYIDVVVVSIPPHCFTRNPLDHQITVPVPSSEDENATADAMDCDWTQHMGVGVRTTDNVVWYCCSDQALEAKACDPEQAGRLILNPPLFQGATRNVTVLSNPDPNAQGGPFTIQVNEPQVVYLSDPGAYVVLLANCNEPHGQTALVNGTLNFVSYTNVWEEYFNENIPFYFIMAIGYAGLWTWYGCLMRQNKESRIRLEEWILITILLGLADVCIQLLQNAIWEDSFNHKAGRSMDHLLQGWHGTSKTLMKLIGVLGAVLGGVKHALSRYLLLMLAIGWGVVHPSIDPVQSVLSAIMAVTYCVANSFVDITLGLLKDTNSQLVDSLFNVSFWLEVTIDILFMIWIPTALCRTMSYLRRSNQLRKLQRYRSLLHILGFAVLLTIGLLALILADWLYDGGSEVNILNVSQVNEFNFFIILLCVARLWRPNPMAREFVYAMELSLTDDDDEYQFHGHNNNHNNGFGGGPLGMDGREGYLTDLELTVTNTSGKPQRSSRIADDDDTTYANSSVEVS